MPDLLSLSGRAPTCYDLIPDIPEREELCRLVAELNSAILSEETGKPWEGIPPEISPDDAGVHFFDALEYTRTNLKEAIGLLYPSAQKSVYDAAYVLIKDPKVLY